jgi:uncharacterized protein YuzE
MEEHSMEAIKFLENTRNMELKYDEEADTLYLSIDKPRPAMSIDVGNGTIVRYDEKSREVVGITFIGLRERFVTNLKQAA